MTRNRKSAKAAGSRFEKSVADYLAAALDDDRIERRARTGAKDRGDVAGVRAHGQRVVIECKNTVRIELAGWVAEAEAERINDDALAGVVVHKRVGKGDPAAQWVTMTLADFAALIGGQRPTGGAVTGSDVLEVPHSAESGPTAALEGENDDDEVHLAQWDDTLGKRIACGAPWSTKPAHSTQRRFVTCPECLEVADRRASVR